MKFNMKMKLGVVAATVLGVLLARPAMAEVAATQPEKRAAFAYAGHVVDERGRPVADVEITATHRLSEGRGFGYIAVVKTDAQGQFSIERVA